MTASFSRGARSVRYFCRAAEKEDHDGASVLVAATRRVHVLGVDLKDEPPVQEKSPTPPLLDLEPHMVISRTNAARVAKWRSRRWPSPGSFATTLASYCCGPSL